MGPQSLLQLHGIGLDPAVDGRMFNRYAPVPQHEFEVAVGDWKLQTSAHHPQDDFRRELTSLERVIPVPHALTVSLPSKHGVLSNPLPREKLQQNLPSEYPADFIGICSIGEKQRS